MYNLRIFNTQQIPNNNEKTINVCVTLHNSCWGGILTSCNKETENQQPEQQIDISIENDQFTKQLTELHKTFFSNYKSGSLMKFDAFLNFLEADFNYYNCYPDLKYDSIFTDSINLKVDFILNDNISSNQMALIYKDVNNIIYNSYIKFDAVLKHLVFLDIKYFVNSNNEYYLLVMPTIGKVNLFKSQTNTEDGYGPFWMGLAPFEQGDYFLPCDLQQYVTDPNVLSSYCGESDFYATEQLTDMVNLLTPEDYYWSDIETTDWIYGAQYENTFNDISTPNIFSLYMLMSWYGPLYDPYAEDEINSDFCINYSRMNAFYNGAFYIIGDNQPLGKTHLRSEIVSFDYICVSCGQVELGVDHVIRSTYGVMREKEPGEDEEIPRFDPIQL